IETGVFYPAAIHEQPLYRTLGFTDVRAPVAERLAGEVLSLPVHPSLSDADVEAIAEAVLASV
ncbi:MAG TPA: DegT/DnrJ/EryC1/StrS family aminotransferase, partial [Dehalococcoidia bacterium]|nr:DegT/DnrJ/EryC1/StrS family aminotransferase [Dehalococcoidia bacterium]